MCTRLSCNTRVAKKVLILVHGFVTHHHLLTPTWSYPVTRVGFKPLLLLCLAPLLLHHHLPGVFNLHVAAWILIEFQHEQHLLHDLWRPTPCVLGASCMNWSLYTASIMLSVLHVCLSFASKRVAKPKGVIMLG